MPSFKNQHFVPKVHLRNFSDDGSSIKLFNILRSTHISGASIRGQCSKNFFYGTDLVLESAFHLPEQLLGHCCDFIRSNGFISKELSTSLMQYVLIQYFRTEAYVSNLRKMESSLNAALTEDPRHLGQLEKQIETNEELLKYGFGMAVKFFDFIDLFNFSLVQAGGNGEFFTSDNPSFRMNPYAQLKRPHEAVGLFNAGTVFQFPISSEFVFLAYDRHCYTLPASNERKVYVCKSQEDVLALNEATYVHAFKNIYYKSDIRNQLAKIAPGADDLRNQFGTQLNFAVFDRQNEDGSTVFKSVEQSESYKHERVLVHLEQKYPKIRTRFRPLKVRSTFSPFDTKSGAGVYSNREVYERVNQVR